MTKNQNVLKWVEEMKALTQPDKVVWIDGSEEQLKALRDEAIATGEMIELNQEKLPGCLYHRTAENDVARVEDRTFISSREKSNRSLLSVLNSSVPSFFKIFSYRARNSCDVSLRFAWRSFGHGSEKLR